MKRYCLIRRVSRGGTFYCHHLKTGKRESLATKDKAEAERIINAKHEALRNPYMNLQLAKVFLMGADERLIKRTWDEVFRAIIETRQGPTRVSASSRQCKGRVGRKLGRGGLTPTPPRGLKSRNLLERGVYSC